jgi:hypothetical protein
MTSRGQSLRSSVLWRRTSRISTHARENSIRESQHSDDSHGQGANNRAVVRYAGRCGCQRDEQRDVIDRVQNQQRRRVLAPSL